MVNQVVQQYCVTSQTAHVPSDKDMSCSLAPAAGVGVSDLTLAAPSRVRVQVTLAATDEERREGFREHEVLDEDTVQKLALQYAVTVAAIKAANRMIDNNVMGYKSLLIPKQRDGHAPGQDRAKMLTVLPSVSWSSFMRQVCALHTLELQELHLQCLSKVIDEHGNVPWIVLNESDGLAQQLQRTHDADLSEDFLRVRITRKQSGGQSTSDKNMLKPLTYDSTNRRKGHALEDADSGGSARQEDAAPSRNELERTKARLQATATASPVRAAYPNSGDSGGGGGSSGGGGWLCGGGGSGAGGGGVLGRLLCCLPGGGGGGGGGEEALVLALSMEEIQRLKLKKHKQASLKKQQRGKGGGEDAGEQAVALLHVERHYSQA